MRADARLAEPGPPRELVGRTLGIAASAQAPFRQPLTWTEKRSTPAAGDDHRHLGDSVRWVWTRIRLGDPPMRFQPPDCQASGLLFARRRMRAP